MSCIMTSHMTETLMVQKVAYIFASLCEGEGFSYLCPVLRKNSENLGKKEKKIRKTFAILCSKNPERKKFHRHLRAKR